MDNDHLQLTPADIKALLRDTLDTLHPIVHEAVRMGWKVCNIYASGGLALAISLDDLTEYRTATGQTLPLHVRIHQYLKRLEENAYVVIQSYEVDYVDMLLKVYTKPRRSLEEDILHSAQRRSEYNQRELAPLEQPTDDDESTED